MNSAPAPTFTAPDDYGRRYLVVSTETVARAKVAAAAVEALLALSTEERRAVREGGYKVRPVPALLPEVAAAHDALPEGLELHNARMADGTGFAEVRSTSTYGVILSSERYPDAEDLVQRYAALSTVAQAILTGALD